MSRAYGRLRRFLGPRVFGFLLAGLAIGLSLFAVELAFAYGLQAFLLAIGALEAKTTRLPAWLAQASLAQVLLVVVTVGILRALLNAAQIYYQGAANEELRCRVRRFVITWALWSESTSTADVMTIFNARAEAAGILVGGVQTMAIQLTSAGLLAAGLFAMAPMITAATGAGMGLIALGLLYADRRALSAGAGLAAGMDKTNARLLMSIKNLLLLQILGTRAREEDDIQGSLQEFRGHVLSYYRITALKYAVPQIFGVALICLIALASTSRHGMPPGVLVSYFYLLLRLLLIFSAVNQCVSTILMTWPNTRALFEWFEESSPDAVAPDREAPAQARAPVSEPVGWRLSGVSFRYPSGDRPVLSGLDLEVAPGRALVVMGPSGAGKSTLLALMLGLVKPDAGSVELLLADGSRQALEPRRAELLRGVGYVGPETFLIEGTIRENLLYGLESPAGDAQLKEALEKAECGFARELPRGLDHELTEQGQGLSAGQKQRLALARALLRRPRVLILDEATANLDLDTEARLIASFARLKGAMTLLIVTHRASLLALADLRLDLAPSSRPPIDRGRFVKHNVQ